MRLRSVLLALLVLLLSACASDVKIRPVVYRPAGPDATESMTPLHPTVAAGAAKALAMSSPPDMPSASEAMAPMPPPPRASISASKPAGKSTAGHVTPGYQLAMAAGAESGGGSREPVRLSAAESVASKSAAFTRFEKLAIATAKAAVADHATSEIPIASEVPKPPAVSNDGAAAYYVPHEMVHERPSFVDLWIDRKAPAATLARELAKHLQLTAEKIKQRTRGQASAASGPPAIGEVTALSGIKVGDVMVAQLRGGEDFGIDPKDPLPQSLKEEGRVQWNWRVTPKRSGEDGLPLVLEVWINPGPNQRIIHSVREVVIVKARPRTWYEILQEFDKWLALLGAGGIGGLIIAIRKWSQKRRQTATEASSQASPS